MPKYEVMDNETGKRYELEGDSPPTEQELTEIFGQQRKSHTTTQVTDYARPTADTKEEAQQRLMADSRITSDDMQSALIPDKKALSQLARPVLQAGGMIGGGIVGAGAGVGVGSIPLGVAGAGLGYAAGEQVANKIDEAMGLRQSKPVAEELMQAGKDVGTGAVMEMGGQIVGAAAKPVLQGAGKLAKRMYQSGLKPSTTLTEQARNKVLETGLNEGIPIGKGGLDYSKKTISEINKDIKSRIAAQANQGATIPRQPITSSLDTLAEREMAENILPGQNINALGSIQSELVENLPENIPIGQAQTFKQTLNKELNDYWKAYNSGKVVPPQVTAKAKATIASELRNQISDVIPEVKNLNQREGNLIEFNKQLTRAVNRMSNNNLFGLVKAISMSGNFGAIKGFALDTLLNNPRITSRMARALWKGAKANPNTIANIGKAGLLATEEDE